MERLKVPLDRVTAAPRMIRLGRAGPELEKDAIERLTDRQITGKRGGVGNQRLKRCSNKRISARLRSIEGTRKPAQIWKLWCNFSGQ